MKNVRFARSAAALKILKIVNGTPFSGKKIPIPANCGFVVTKAAAVVYSPRNAAIHFGRISPIPGGCAVRIFTAHGKRTKHSAKKRSPKPAKKAGLPTHLGWQSRFFKENILLFFTDGIQQPIGINNFFDKLRKRLGLVSFIFCYIGNHACIKIDGNFITICNSFTGCLTF